jgi:hypothetical protein
MSNQPRPRSPALAVLRDGAFWTAYYGGLFGVAYLAKLLHW